MATDRLAERNMMEVEPEVRFGPCNYCSQPLVRLADGWGVAGDDTAKTVPSRKMGGTKPTDSATVRSRSVPTCGRECRS